MFPSDTKILVVDDMMTMRKIVKKALTDMGFKNFLEAKDGQEAWQIINDGGSNVQLVVSDWNMPNCTGLDLLKRVRADGRMKNVPFILVTAESEGSQVKEAIESGADDYVTKPFQGDTLRQKLERVYKKRAA